MINESLIDTKIESIKYKYRIAEKNNKVISHPHLKLKGNLLRLKYFKLNRLKLNILLYNNSECFCKISCYLSY